MKDSVVDTMVDVGLLVSYILRGMFYACYFLSLVVNNLFLIVVTDKGS